MRPAVFVLMLCMLGFGLSPQIEAVRLVDGDYHTLKMTAICDIFEVTGNFYVEFRTARSHKVSGSINDPVLADFNYLVIEASDISINNKFKAKNRNLKVETKNRTSLKIFPGDNINREILIKRIKNLTQDSSISFHQGLKKQYVSLGKDSIIDLENNFLDLRPWVLELNGEFGIIDNDTGEPLLDSESDIKSSMSKAVIKFNGSLSVEQPQVLNTDSFSVDFEFSDIEELSLRNCHIAIRSDIRSDLKGNEFRDMVEDDFRIDMTKEIFEKDSYAKDFRLRDIEIMEVEEIKESDGRLMIKSPRIRYSGKTLFPKIRVITCYYLVNENAEEFLVEISSLSPTNYEKLNFLVGETYRVHILIEKFVKDDIMVNLADNNCEFFIPENGSPKIVNNLNLGPQKSFRDYEYFFTVDPRGIDKTSECWTEVSYRKKGQDSEFKVMTGIFKAEISCNINPIITIKESEFFNGDTIEGGGTFETELVVALPSETSASVTVDAFIIPDERFTVMWGELHKEKELEKGDSLLMRVELKAPLDNKEKETCKIQFIVYYYIENSAYYNYYKSEKEVIVEPLKPTFTSNLEEITGKLLPVVTFFVGIFTFLNYQLLKEFDLGLKQIPNLFRPDEGFILDNSDLGKKRREKIKERCPSFKNLRNLKENEIRDWGEDQEISKKDIRALKNAADKIAKARVKFCLFLISVTLSAAIIIFLAILRT
jgi:hypothetical protein